MKFSGILPALATPLDKDERINTDALKIKHLCLIMSLWFYKFYIILRWLSVFLQQGEVF